MITFKSRLPRALFLGCLLQALAGPARAAAKHVKFATLAPEGSTWMKVMSELNAELREKTGGALALKMYPGGVSGDEKDVVKKIRINQLHAAGFTGVGLGEISPEVRVLDSPWLFQNVQEVDHVHKLFDPDFQAAVRKGGYRLLGWVDLGSVYLFSKKPIRGPEDMKQAKMWVWEGDPIAQAAYGAIGVSPIPLSVVDVLSSLQTGMIDAVYGPPMGVLALQWFTRTKYIYPVPMAYATGAVLISNKFFDGQLSEAEQKTLLEISAKHLKRLNQLSREENDQALKSLQKQGLVLSGKPSPDTLELYQELGKKARQELAGRLYSAQLLKKVEKSLEKLRAGKNGKNESTSR
ncbi:MAG: TRAP transporter substrate-binding protein DctP [Elusimicrobia bacterium]|nr:TRAP transporter substrate-binding protein DctP [Elusimicrobiota bacterium]